MDDFQRAAAAAKRHYTEAGWLALPPGAQSKAIYTELRRIDAERVSGVLRVAKPRSALRAGVAPSSESQIPAHAD